MMCAAADFTHDVAPPHGLFTSQLLSLIVNNLHTHSPTISFTPLVYHVKDFSSDPVTPF